MPDAEPDPDVIAVRGKYTGAYLSKAPDLCIEILSPGDTLARANRTEETDEGCRCGNGRETRYPPTHVCPNCG